MQVTEMRERLFHSFARGGLGPKIGSGGAERLIKRGVCSRELRHSFGVFSFARVLTSSRRDIGHSSSAEKFIINVPLKCPHKGPAPRG